MYTAPKTYNSFSTIPQLPVSPPPGRRHRTWWVIVMAVLGVLLAALLLVYTRGIDIIMQMVGVGASGIYQISLTNTNDWLGTNAAKPQLIGGANLEGTNVFAKFSAVPDDMDLSAQGVGLVTSIFSSPGDPTQEIYSIHEYTSPIVDLGYVAPYLSAIEVADFNPPGGQINYAYRIADDIETMGMARFTALDPSIAGNSQSAVSVRTAVIGQPVKRYIQAKFELLHNTAQARSAVYAINFQYKKSAGVTDLQRVTSSGQLAERNITVKYESVNAPSAADVDVVSANLEDAIVYSAQGIDLGQGRLSYSFTTALTTGAYALTISAPLMNTKIVPFLVGDSNQITVNAGSFEQSEGKIAGDLNGDGVVNSIDFLLQYSQINPQ